jgi:hypothetical protein
VRLRRKSQSRDPCNGNRQRGGHDYAAIRPLSLLGLDSCLRRIFRWRVPPNWSIFDWHNEMRAEAACAAWQAVCHYDPSLNVPFSAFARQRVLTSTLTRYRQEWAYALRLAQETDPEDLDSGLLGSTAPTVFDDWPRHALARLSKRDLWLLEQLFLRGSNEADIATQIGITQQAVNKRKWRIVHRLHQYMVGVSSPHRGVVSARNGSGKPRVSKPDTSSKKINKFI